MQDTQFEEIVLSYINGNFKQMLGHFEELSLVSKHKFIDSLSANSPQNFQIIKKLTKHYVK